MEDSMRANSDLINASLADNSGSSFWKCWNSTYNSDTRTQHSAIINNLSNHSEIANSFKTYFESTFVNSSDDSNATKEFHNLYSNLSSNSLSSLIIDIPDIEEAVGHLGLKKSADPDNLFSEHFLHSHLSIVIHLKTLFNLILKHSFVPDCFTRGVPLS